MKEIWIWILTCVIMVLAIGCVALGDTVGRLRSQAIEHGYAGYNQKTGDWQWLEINNCNQAPNVAPNVDQRAPF